MNWWEDPTLAAHYVLRFAMGPMAVFGAQVKQPGSYAEALVKAIFLADRQQRAIMRQSYPVFVDAVVKYKDEEHGHEELAALVREDTT